MSDAPGRLLRLLGILQAHPGLSGRDLAHRLSVTSRTVRRDVDRLRALGYPVETEHGTAGYRLGVGGSLPPLLLDDDEALAVTIGLQGIVGGSPVEGIEESAARALVKLEGMLPSRIRYRVRTVGSTTARVDSPRHRIPVDDLVRITDACARRERLRFDYVAHDGAASRREVEPQSLVHYNRQWYLVAWDPTRDDWRTFRPDRMRLVTPNGARFAPRDPPEGGVVEHLDRRLSSGVWAVRATVRFAVSAAVLAPRVWPGTGTVEAVDDESCLLHIGAPAAKDIVWIVAALDEDFTVSGPPEVIAAFDRLARRCRTTADRPDPHSGH